MNSILLEQALKVVPNTSLLVNMVRLRVRQLLAGARPLILLKPGLALSDIALTEIAAEKLVSERAVAAVVEIPAAAIMNFSKSKAAVKAA